MPGNIRLYGTTGYVELAAPATGNNATLTLPTDSIQPGVVLVANQTFTSTTSVILNNCFSTTYDNYRIIVRVTHSASSNFFARLRSAGTDASGSNYYHNGAYVQGATAPATYNSNAATAWNIIVSSSYLNRLITLDVAEPFKAANTSMLCSSQETNGSLVGEYSGGGWHLLANSYDGFSITFDNNSTGYIKIYGYRN